MHPGELLVVLILADFDLHDCSVALVLTPNPLHELGLAELSLAVDDTAHHYDL